MLYVPNVPRMRTAPLCHMLACIYVRMCVFVPPTQPQQQHQTNNNKTVNNNQPVFAENLITHYRQHKAATATTIASNNKPSCPLLCILHNDRDQVFQTLQHILRSVQFYFFSTGVQHACCCCCILHTASCTHTYRSNVLQASFFAHPALQAIFGDQP